MLLISARPEITATRELSHAAASIISASRRGFSIPAAASSAETSAISRPGEQPSRTSLLREFDASGTQSLGLLFGCKCIDNRIQPAIKHLVELMEREIHAMIRDP